MRTENRFHLWVGPAILALVLSVWLPAATAQQAPAAAKGGKKEVSAPAASQKEAPKPPSIDQLPKPVQDTVIKEFGANPSLMVVEERKVKVGGALQADYRVKTRLPGNQELELRILKDGQLRYRELYGVKLEDVPEIVVAAAEKEIGTLKAAADVKLSFSKRSREKEIKYILRKTVNQLESRIEILDSGRPLAKREQKNLADLAKGIQDAVNKEMAAAPGATAMVRWVTEFDKEGKPQKPFVTAEVRGKDLAIDMRLAEDAAVISREDVK